MMLSRRRLLVAAGAAVLSGCGGANDASSGTPRVPSAGGSTPTGGVDLSTLQLVQRFPSTVLVPGSVRMPMSLAEASGQLLVGGPDELTADVVDEFGTVVATIAAPRRQLSPDTPSYWSLRAELAAPGLYTVRVGSLEAAIQLFEPTQVTIPVPGSALPPFDTPTVDDHRGVEPYCSRLEGPCPFHDVTLTEALNSATPVVYVVGTPAHCSTGTCAPGLEFIIAASRRVGSAVTFVHADVYADDAATTIAPAVTALNLSFEPVVFAAGADGIVVDRLDAIWDQREVDNLVDALI
jgi:hypothetical protein